MELITSQCFAIKLVQICRNPLKVKSQAVGTAEQFVNRVNCVQCHPSVHNVDSTFKADTIITTIVVIATIIIIVVMCPLPSTCPHSKPTHTTFQARICIKSQSTLFAKNGFAKKHLFFEAEAQAWDPSDYIYISQERLILIWGEKKRKIIWRWKSPRLCRVYGSRFIVL